MAEETHDYSDFQDASEANVLVEVNLKRLQEVAQLQLQAEARLAGLVEQTAEAQANLRRIQERELPELMEKLELVEFTMNNGIKIKLSEIIRASIPKGSEAPAFAWLEEHNHGGLIKREIKIEFGKGDEKWANKFERDCAQRKKPLNLARKKMVHAGTLTAFVKEQLREGEPIPQDIFGVFRQHFTKVELPKE